MDIYLGADHGGYAHKKRLMEWLKQHGHTSHDCGAFILDPHDDYPEFAHEVAKQVVSHAGSVGILLCRSGEGMAMAANRFTGIRAAVAWSQAVAHEARKDNDANVLVLPADYISDRDTVGILATFLQTEFSRAPRHTRRIHMLDELGGERG